jgi:CheY-like chemotaxis protein
VWQSASVARRGESEEIVPLEGVGTGTHLARQTTQMGANAATRNSGAPVELKRPRILLAEDDPNLRAFLTLLLTTDGYEVIEVSDGGKLGEYIAGHFLRYGDSPLPVDLIVTDVRMPGLTGLDILQELRRVGSSTPVILMTAFGSDEIHARARRLGAAATLDKPFEIDDLRMLVQLLVPLESPGVGKLRSRLPGLAWPRGPEE